MFDFSFLSRFSDTYKLYLFLLLFWGLLILLVYLFRRRFQKLDIKMVGSFLIANCGFSILGLTTGLMIGLSKSPVVGVIMSALLTFFGGVVIFAFVSSKEGKNYYNSLLLSFSMIFLSLFLFLGSDYGASIRNQQEFDFQQYEIGIKQNHEIFLRELKKGLHDQDTIKTNANPDDSGALGE